MSAIRTNRKGRMYRPGTFSIRAGVEYLNEERARLADSEGTSEGLVLAWTPVGEMKRNVDGTARHSPYLSEKRKKSTEG